LFFFENIRVFDKPVPGQDTGTVKKMSKIEMDFLRNFLEALGD